MARRRKFKINKQTIFNIFGFIIIGSALVLLISFLNNFTTVNDGRILFQINQILVSKFGGLSIFLPIILLLVSGHFFNTKKLKFVKPNITLGIIMVFFALISVFQSGLYGKIIFDNLALDFTNLGAVVILSIVFIIGLVFFLDTSIDVFFIFIIDIFKTIGAVFKNGLTKRGNNSNNQLIKKEEKLSKKNQEFIPDSKIEERPKNPLPILQKINQPIVNKSTQIISNPSDITIKPLSQSTNTTWVYPPLTLLADIEQKEAERGDVNKNASTIEKTLDSFGIRARVSEVNYGPAVTQYALEITIGTKLSKITALGNDLALALAASSQVRIEAPIPGRSLVGIEIPNKRPEIVTLKKLLSSPIFTNNPDPLLVPLGLDVSGQPQATSISKMPHVLIAGATGSGKSVMLNAWISTFLYRTKPQELRMILVDPKRVELTSYNGIPHLLTEVIVDREKIISALRWTVKEMETRYKEFAKVGARNIEGFNATEGVEKKPFILFVIDELADIMIFAPRDAEELITRIAQMSRATGIHLILATQRPSVDVITGLMKANIPTRVAFNVSSMVDSRVIIDMPGAEKLLGKGDMLFLPPDQAKPRRIQGPFVTDKEVNTLVKFLRSQVPEVHYTEEVVQEDTSVVIGGTSVLGGGGANDPLFEEAVKIIIQHDKASASLLQRRLAIGYARAARLLDQLEAAGYVSVPEGSKPREVIKRQISEDTSIENPEINQ